MNFKEDFDETEETDESDEPEVFEKLELDFSKGMSLDRSFLVKFILEVFAWSVYGRNERFTVLSLTFSGTVLRILIDFEVLAVFIIDFRKRNFCHRISA